MAGISTGPMAGQTVLVTGGTGGIGKATAAGLAAMGARAGVLHQRSATDGFGEVSEQLPVGVHRPGDEAATVEGEDHRVLGGPGT